MTVSIHVTGNNEIQNILCLKLVYISHIPKRPCDCGRGRGGGTPKNICAILSKYSM